MEEANTSQLNIFPNPSDGLINIEIIGSLAYNWSDIYVVNTAGYIVYKTSIDAVSGKLLKTNLSKLNSGTYFIRLVAKNKYSMAGKIIIQH